MYLLEEDLKFPKDSFKSMKYQPYEMKPSFSMVRVYQWWNYLVRRGLHIIQRRTG